jgi:hypothetical protein
MIDWSYLPDLWPLWLVYGALAVVGGIVTARAFSAFRQRRSTPLLLLASGLLLFTVGMPVAWTGAYFLSGDMYVCTLSSMAPAVAGAGLLLASIQ